MVEEEQSEARARNEKFSRFYTNDRFICRKINSYNLADFIDAFSSMIRLVKRNPR